MRSASRSSSRTAAAPAAISAFAWVARTRPDGYTLLLAPNSFAVNPSLYDKVAYDPFKDFEPVAEISSFPDHLRRAGGPGRQYAARN